MFKYENVPIFCFICGLLGHSQKLCIKLFDVPEKEIVKSHGVWMRTPLKKQTKLIGSRWLRDGSTDDGRKTVDGDAGGNQSDASNHESIFLEMIFLNSRIYLKRQLSTPSRSPSSLTWSCG